MLQSRYLPSVCALLCACWVAASSAPTSADDEVRVFILAGQSNMVGSGTLAELPAELSASQHDVRYSWRVVTSNALSSDAWGPLRHFAGAPPVGVSYGPEVSFGRQLADALPSDDIAILKIAQNGSSLTNHWDPNIGSAYLPMFDYADAALAQLVDEGLTPIIEAFVWVQGTGDARTLEFAEAYDDNLNEMMGAIRERYDQPDMPLIFSQIHADAELNFTISNEDITAMQESQNAVADADPNAWLINVDDLPLRSPGDVHFSSDGLIAMGRRLADLYLSDLRGLASADFDFDGAVDGDDVYRWSTRYSLAESATRADGDANGDGRVDGLDFLAFQQQAHFPVSDGSAIPEPSAAIIGLLATCIAAAARVRRPSA